MKLYAGWDVGAWHCDSNRKSRDAMVLLTSSPDGPMLVGRPTRGSLRDILTGSSGRKLIDGMLSWGCLDADLTSISAIVIAIDTPLGWPEAMIQLVTDGRMASVSAADAENPYTRRRTELELVKRNFRPLSTVRDQLGSQSTKGIHFLRAAKLRAHGCGAWKSEDQPLVTAIETYPAAAIKLGRTNSLREEVLPQMDGAPLPMGTQPGSDIGDALTCAVVAYLYGETPWELEPAPAGVSEREGWILIPKEEAHAR